MSKNVLYEGPDISSHNGNVDIKRIRDAGCKRVGIRAGYGKNNIDQKYIKNAQACYNLGVLPLIYWFSYALNDDMVKNEADFACEQAEKFWKRCPVAFDYEYDSVRYARTKGVNPTKKSVTSHAITFLRRVRERGHIPVLYTNRDYLRNYFDMDRITKEVGIVYVWYARYKDNLPSSEQNITDIWQYTSKGRLPGASGNIDLNRFYCDFFLEAEKKEEVVVSSNINILNFQKAANVDRYRDQNGKKLAEDGIDGPKTQYARKQILLKAKWTPLGYKVGSAGTVVRWLQGRCNEILGTNYKIDGLYGKDTRKMVIEVQKKLGLAVDGIAGYNTIQALFYN